jgi:hypothetical protein
LPLSADKKFIGGFMKKSKHKTESADTWIPVGKLSKRSDFRCNKTEGPIDSLHATIKRLVPDVESIMEVGVSETTNAFFREKLKTFAKKRYPWLSEKKLESSVAMALLNAEPCDVPGGEDFVLYRRKVK